MATKRKGTKPTADQLEEQARQEWEELLREHVPGFAFSDHPSGFVLRNAAKGLSFIGIGEWWKDPKRWPEVPGRLGSGPPERAVKVPKAWRYADIAPATPPHPFDLTNLRKYDLHGRQVPGHYGRSYAATAMTNFRRRLLEVFLAAPLNRKSEEVTAFLEHHHSNGGNPRAFHDHVEGLLSMWAEEPPTDPRRLEKVPLGIEDLHRLTKAVEAWLDKAPDSPAPRLLNGRQLALVHFYRCKAREATVPDSVEQAKDVLKSNPQHNLTNAKSWYYDHWLHVADPTTGKARRLRKGGADLARVVEYLSGTAKAHAEAELSEVHQRQLGDAL